MLTEPWQTPKYVMEEQFKMMIDKVEQLHLKLEHLQPVARDCEGEGSTARSTLYGNRTHEQENGRRLTRCMYIPKKRLQSRKSHMTVSHDGG
ncbi:hypothetical protein ABVT39_001624 [Epinephelus coioides]